MKKIGIIGGSGIARLAGLEVTGQDVVQTPYGEPSDAFTSGYLYGQEVVFLARHGYSHHIPPHRINYRANIWAFRYLEVESVVAVAAVGGIRDDMPPAHIVIPDQIIDYSYDREHTFFDKNLSSVTHIDFSQPYCSELRKQIISAAKATEIEFSDAAVYAVTQGPRLETAAEIDRLERDGCDIVGMTGMPEAALARELELCYATLAVVANRAAGRGSPEILMEEIERNLAVGMQSIMSVLEQLLSSEGV